MKYFTQELLELADSSDEGTAQTAHEEWERRIGEYQKHLGGIEIDFPRALRELAKMNLHDSRILEWGQSLQERRLFILLQTESGRGKEIIVTYHISKPCEFANDRSPAMWQEPLEWLYDELDAETQDGVTTFQHSILLTNGVELRVYFHEAEFEKYDPLRSMSRGLRGSETACRALPA